MPTASPVLRCFVGALLGLGAAALAQSPGHLVGLTKVASDLRHVSSTACGVLATCAPAGFPSGVAQPAMAGGTAWDAAHSGAWITDGSFLACVDDACAYKCAPVAVPGLPGGVVLTGLEVVDKLNQLWATDSAGNLRRFDLSACPPVALAPCAIAFANPFETTGLAVDELRGLVFYGRHDPVTGANFLTVALEALPCSPTQLLNLPVCAAPMLGLRGLAVDAGQQRLFWTDGSRIGQFDYVPSPVAPGIVALTGFQCCPPPAVAVDPLVGLAVRPGRATSTGVSCTNGTCAACPMTHATVGDSVLGNLSFALRLDNAPPGSLAWCFVGAGACQPAGVPLPPLCGFVHLPNVLGTLGANPLPIGGVCSSTDFPLALPAAVGLAGALLSSQCLVLCPGGVGGFGLSHCLSFELQAN
ncbi:MAG: hypothetical protein JNK15_18745 [Planctomycetes bacterium]|nr:hypothetical protein [Planctomycetota bacterium]